MGTTNSNKYGERQYEAEKIYFRKLHIKRKICRQYEGFH